MKLLKLLNRFDGTNQLNEQNCQLSFGMRIKLPQNIKIANEPFANVRI